MEKDQHAFDLYDVIVNIENKDEARSFFTDLCTPQEVRAMQERWKVCQLLYEGNMSYREIHDATGSSIATIGRVARFLKEEPYKGYVSLLRKLNGEKGE